MEMMLVLAIIALLIAIGAVTLGEVDENAKVTAAQAQMSTVKTALLQYKTLTRSLPTQAQGLEALVTRPGNVKNWRAVAKPEAILDPWGNKIQYRNPGKTNPQGYDLFSIGPDKKEGTEDDVTLE